MQLPSTLLQYQCFPCMKILSATFFYLKISRNVFFELCLGPVLLLDLGEFGLWRHCALFRVLYSWRHWSCTRNDKFRVLFIVPPSVLVQSSNWDPFAGLFISLLVSRWNRWAYNQCYHELHEYWPWFAIHTFCFLDYNHSAWLYYHAEPLSICDMLLFSLEDSLIKNFC